jgi:hypothetical protein
MAWRRKVVTEPEVEWTRPVQELEAAAAPVEPSLALPPPPPAPTPVHRIPRVDPQRAVLTACAVIGALALVATALMQRDLRDASRRQNCFVEAQYRTFADTGSIQDQERFGDLLAECGVDLRDPDDEDAETDRG